MSTQINTTELLSLKEAQLYVRIGNLVGGATGALPSDDDDDPESVGRRWWVINLQRIHDIVCNSEKVRAACEGKTWDRITVCSVVVDALTLAFGSELSLALSSLVMKQGLVEACSKNWN